MAWDWEECVVCKFPLTECIWQDIHSGSDPPLRSQDQAAQRVLNRAF